MKELHDDLDEAVSEAYGWPTSISDDNTLERLVALNTGRAVEEAQGLVSWLRPENQQPEGTSHQADMGLVEEAAVVQLVKQSWSKSLPEQAQAVRQIVVSLNQPATSAVVAKQFKGARTGRVGELLETLALLGQVRVVGGDQYVA